MIVGSKYPLAHEPMSAKNKLPKCGTSSSSINDTFEALL
jgi:hypothetical protein